MLYFHFPKTKLTNPFISGNVMMLINLTLMRLYVKLAQVKSLVQISKEFNMPKTEIKSLSILKCTPQIGFVDLISNASINISFSDVRGINRGQCWWRIIYVQSQGLKKMSHLAYQLKLKVEDKRLGGHSSIKIPMGFLKSWP